MLEFGFLVGIGGSGGMIGRLCLNMVLKSRVMAKQPIILTTIKFTNII